MGSDHTDRYLPAEVGPRDPVEREDVEMAKKVKEVKTGVDGLFNVSNSKVKTYRRCHYAYHLRYVEKLRKKTKSRPLAFGTLAHSVLDHWAEGNDWGEMLKEVYKANSKVFKAERELYGEILDDVRVIMTGYFNHWGERSLSYERVQGRSAEHVFNIEVLPGINMTGKIDFKGLTKDRGKKHRWIGEHKTFNRKPSDDDRWRNLQSAIYIRVNDLLGWSPVEGMCWDYIWSKPPQVPGVLQDGSMSQKMIDTLPERIVEILRGEKINPKKYQAFIDRVAEVNYPKYFDRVFTPVNNDVVENVMSDFLSTAAEMAERHGKVKDKNIERHCSWCDYQDLCRAELQGLDADYVRQRQYTKEKENEIEIPDPTD